VSSDSTRVSPTAVAVEPMSAEPTAIDGLWIIKPKSITDERGTVREFFRLSGFTELGIKFPERWTQINMTWTRRGALRGMHGEQMTKLVGVAAGAAFGAYIDARDTSATRGAVVNVELTVGVQVLVPAGVCNGFQAVSEDGCQYVYCFDAEWFPGMPGIAFNPLDPALGITWPIPVDTNDPAQISVKDATAPPFAALQN
jgi:dTDP-4-dehydrorhamnose 3,5-epimerase